MAFVPRFGYILKIFGYILRFSQVHDPQTSDLAHNVGIPSITP